MKHILLVALIISMGLCAGCGPAGGSDADAQASQCLSSAWLAQSDGGGKTLAELIEACNQRAIASNATDIEASN